MIVFVTTRAHQYTVRAFVRSYGALRGDRVVLRSYERLLASVRHPRAVYVFADVERLAPPEAEQAADLWQRLADRGSRLLNHPTRSMRRYELLRTLHERGMSAVDVFRVAEHRTPSRFPVFLRAENDHGGSRTALLPDGAALAEALAVLDRDGRSREDALITEFCETRDAAGLYRKYGAFCIAGQIVPRHLFFNDGWMAKSATRFDAPLLEEERRYLATNPHDDSLRTIFALAGIDYGRIDYAVHEGRVQVWEINTNPEIVSYRYSGGIQRLPLQREFAARFAAALHALDRER